MPSPDDPLSAPLLSAWDAFLSTRRAPFTIPGHKGRAGAVWPTLGRLVDQDVPMFGGLAPVADAVRVVAAAESAAAHAWGADWCRFSTGGTTHANQAVALALGRPGERVLVARSAHRSTLLGLVLAGLEPVWLPTDVDPEHGLPIGVRPEVLAAAVRDHPDAVAVLLTEPSYVGTVSDLPALITIAHDAGLRVAVDQAWGAHFGFHPDHPPHALALGADAMVFSAHKTLPSYTQASVVLARTQHLDVDRLERAFDAGFTTSPSGNILASIDAARAVLESPHGPALLGRLQVVVSTARRRLASELPGAWLPSPADFPPGRFDPAKLVVRLTGTGLSGRDLEARLIAAGCPVEQADRDTVVPIVTMLDDDDSVGTLCDVIAAAAADLPRHDLPRFDGAWSVPLPPTAVSPRTAFFAEHVTVPATEAVGRVCAELVAPYPPGIPVLVPGEIVTAESLAVLRAAAAAGVRIAYAADPALATIQVLTTTGCDTYGASPNT